MDLNLFNAQMELVMLYIGLVISKGQPIFRVNWVLEQGIYWVSISIPTIRNSLSGGLNRRFCG